jgi:hypothetical protein
MVRKVLLATSVTFFCTGIALGVKLAALEGHLDFLRPAHYISLFILIASYILSWVAMTWMASPDKFSVSSKQWIAFMFTILMAIFWFGRYLFTIADAAESLSAQERETENIKMGEGNPRGP